MSDHDTPRPGADSGDAAYARLEAADPAAEANVDLAAVRREVDRRIAEAPVTAVTPPVRSGPPRWLQVAAVAATVALVGSAAFVVGRETGGADDGVGPAAAASTPSVPSSGGVVFDGAPAAAVAGATESSGGDMQSKLAGWGGRLHFNDGGLGTDGGAAEAFALDAAPVATPETAGRVAAALGVSGSPQILYGSWTVGPNDGSGPFVSIGANGSLQYNDNSLYLNDTSCPSSAGSAEPAPASDANGAPIGPACVSLPSDDGAPLTTDEAIARAQGVLSDLGVDPAGFDFSVPDDQPSGDTRLVTAAPTVGAAVADRTWSLSFKGQALEYAFGSIATVVSLGEYDVVSPAAALQRMNDPRFGVSGGMASPLADSVRFQADGSSPGADGADPSTGETAVVAPSVPAAGAPLAWPVTEITITAASPELMSHYQPDGGTVLLPGYTMTDDTGGTWTVLAVADDQLDFTG
ncbi:hypothetical protein [Nakamurella deserti]|uniref:hypothetical protein n=1 Tax=Nakamurella deserti TaxID=2164074 RepID=UPI000DBE8EE0|nr:hypothetical protein [Nakamurella deserti]